VIINNPPDVSNGGTVATAALDVEASEAPEVATARVETKKPSIANKYI
jgi:hypothetical protein